MKTATLIAIAKKDLLEVRQNKAAWMPMLIVPLIFVILLPLGAIYVPQIFDIAPEVLLSDPEMQTFFDNMPPSMTEQLAGYDSFQRTLILGLGYIFAPFFLIFPLMFSTVIAAESFAGERERKTMEALLYTPATDAELFLGKTFAALIPAVAISWGSFLIYALILNTAGFPIFGRIWFPLAPWWPLIFWITPALALLGTSATVLISSKQKTFMGAYQTSASLVVLVLALIIGQVTGVLYFSVGLGLVVGLFFWLIAAALTYLAINSFNRFKLLVDTK
jgi:ABC-type Na+ efflux pump permease subunit